MSSSLGRGCIDHEARYRLSSNGDFPFEPYVRIDDTQLDPSQAAERIVTHFDLARWASDH
jgi:hypothetical protein